MDSTTLKLQAGDFKVKRCWFFPPKMTSHCQPLDQGIIQQFKKLYRKYLLLKAVADLDAGDSSSINV